MVKGIETVCFSKILGNAYPTLPNGGRVVCQRGFPIFINEHAVKYSILLGAWQKGLIAAPEVNIFPRRLAYRDAQKRVDVAVAVPEGFSIVIECKNKLFESFKQLPTYAKVTSYLFEAAPYSDRMYEEVSRYKEQWLINLTDSFHRFYPTLPSDFVSRIGRILINLANGQIIEIMSAKPTDEPDIMFDILKSPSSRLGHQIHDMMVAIVAKHFIDKGYDIAFEQVVPYAGMEELKFGWSPFGIFPGRIYFRRARKGHFKIDMVAVSPSREFIGIEVKAEEELMNYENWKKILEQVKSYIKSVLFNEFCIAVPQSCKHLGLKLLTRLRSHFQSLRDHIHLILVDIEKRKMYISNL